MTETQTEPEGSGYSDLGMQVLINLKEPQPIYKKLLEGGGTVEPMEGVILNFSRANTEFVLRNHEIFSSEIEMSLGNTRPLIPLNVDPPRHANYRKLLDPLFAPKRMDEQEADITRRVNALIDSFLAAGECNFSEQFAELFPTSVFLGLLGLPEEELPMFLRLRDGVLHSEKIDPDAAFDGEKRRAVQDATGQEIYDYFGKLIELRQREPTEDIITRFLHAEIDNEKLSHDDILDICFLFLIAGLDTVTDSLTCFFAFLAQHPDHRRQIVEDPSVIAAAVEELLRWESPVPSGPPRRATRDVEMPDGHKVKEGSSVMISYGAANLDAASIEDPFSVRFDRGKNPHLAFGGGVHRCLGSHLARRELRVALREWHARIPDYHLKPGHEELEYSAGLRYVKDLTLEWG
jgi:cytochrome P450